MSKSEQTQEYKWNIKTEQQTKKWTIKAEQTALWYEAASIVISEIDDLDSRT